MPVLLTLIAILTDFSWTNPWESCISFAEFSKSLPDLKQFVRIVSLEFVIWRFSLSFGVILISLKLNIWLVFDQPWRANFHLLSVFSGGIYPCICCCMTELFTGQNIPANTDLVPCWSELEHVFPPSCLKMVKLSLLLSWVSTTSRVRSSRA